MCSVLARVRAAMPPDLQLHGSWGQPACSPSLYVAAWGPQGGHCCPQSGQHQLLLLLPLLAVGWCLHGDADEARYRHASQSTQFLAAISSLQLNPGTQQTACPAVRTLLGCGRGCPMLPAHSQDLQGTSLAEPGYAWAALLLPVPWTQHVKLCLIVTSEFQHGLPIGYCQHVARSPRLASS